MLYENYLFKTLNETINQQTMEDMGLMWFRHNQRDPYDRFRDRYMENRQAALNHPLMKKIDDKKKYIDQQYRDATKQGDESSLSYYKKAKDHLYNKRNRLALNIGKSLGYELRPGEAGFNRPASVFNKSAAISTMQQRKGEKSMAAIDRLTRYLDRNGIGQENPTPESRAAFSSWQKRIGPQTMTRDKWEDKFKSTRRDYEDYVKENLL